MSVAAADAQALVGRRREMAQFRAALDACIDGPSGAVILIRGEAGIGKTRLMEELQSAAAASGMKGIRPSFSISGPNADTARCEWWWRVSSAWDPRRRLALSQAQSIRF